MLNAKTIVKESSIVYRLGETLGIKTQDFEIRMPRKINPFTLNYHQHMHVYVSTRYKAFLFWGEEGGFNAW